MTTEIDFEDFISGPENRKDQEKIKKIVQKICSRGYCSKPEFRKYLNGIKRSEKLCCRNSDILWTYNGMVSNNEIEVHNQMEYFLRTKAGKSASGILSVTVFTSPRPEYTDKRTGKRKTQKFTCKWNCYYCPNHPDHPRSYLPDEPGCLRAERCGFDAVRQMDERVTTLQRIGHPVDKLEVLVLGGTWESYPEDYREEYIRDLFYAANVFFDVEKRERYSLQDEQLINEDARCKIIGLTLETRPDTITIETIRTLRYYGATRVQIGIQHTDDLILEKVNRQHTRQHAIDALQLLKDNCFKVDIHLMPDLPGTTVEKDYEMFELLLGVNNKRQSYLFPLIPSLMTFLYSKSIPTIEYELKGPELQADQWKIYPCATTPWTVIEKWYKEGTYKPYAELENGKHLLDLICSVKSRMFPWIRLNRIIRDIPNNHIVGGNQITNLRQHIQTKMKKDGRVCMCIRCREVGLNAHTNLGNDAVIFVRKYDANFGTEYFISYETPDHKTLFGFCRLRISDNAGSAFDCLKNAGLVRELHVYGQLVPTWSKDGKKSTQHMGFGTKLMAKAEEITLFHGLDKIAVIAGIGTRNYYRKLGYSLEDTYLVKNLWYPKYNRPLKIVAIAIIFYYLLKLF